MPPDQIEDEFGMNMEPKPSVSVLLNTNGGWSTMEGFTDSLD